MERIPFFLVLIILQTSLCTMLLGYDVGVMSGAILLIGPSLNLNMVQQQWFVGSLNLISAFFSLISGIISDSCGRRVPIFLGGLMFCLGSIMMAVASNFSVLIAGRIISGIGVGVGMTIPAVYTAEIAPPRLRGLVSGNSDFMINLGIVMGYLANIALWPHSAANTVCVTHTPSQYGDVWGGCPQPATRAWRWMVALGAVPGVLILCTVWAIPESPRWLARVGRLDAAAAVLARTHTEAELKEALDWLRQTTTQHVPIPITTGGDSLIQDDSDRDAGPPRRTPRPLPLMSLPPLHGVVGTCRMARGALWETCRNTGRLLRLRGRARCLATLGVLVALFQQLSGNEAAVYYTPRVLEAAGMADDVTRLWGTALVGTCKLVFIVPAVWLVDSIGRRRLWLGSCLAVCLANLGLAWALSGGGRSVLDTPIPPVPTPPSSEAGGSWPALAALCALMAAFSSGLGPVTFTLATELFPLHVRGVGMALALAGNRLVSGIVASTFLSMAKALGVGVVFVVFSGVALFAFIIVFFFLPETSGMVLEEITHSE